MPTQFINPAGRKNEAVLTSEAIERLKGLGYKFIEKRPQISISDSVCVSCEG